MHLLSSWCEAALEIGSGGGWKLRGVAMKSSAPPSTQLITAMAGMQPVPWENKAVGPEIRENVLRPIMSGSLPSATRISPSEVLHIKDCVHAGPGKGTPQMMAREFREQHALVLQESDFLSS